MNREKLYDRIMLEHRNLIQIHKRLYAVQHLPPGAALEESTDLLTDAAFWPRKPPAACATCCSILPPHYAPTISPTPLWNRALLFPVSEAFFACNYRACYPKSVRKAVQLFCSHRCRRRWTVFVNHIRSRHSAGALSVWSIFTTLLCPTARCETTTTCNLSRY